MPKKLKAMLLSARLSSIQRAIADGAPLQEVFEAIADDCLSLIGPNELVGLRTIHPDDPNFAQIVAARNVDPDFLDLLQRSPVHEGVGGLAIRDNALVVFEDYATHPNAMAAFVERDMRSAMAAPVRENGQAIGSLACATVDPERKYSLGDQLALVTLADHASLAISAAKATAAIREVERDREMFLAMVTHKLKTPLMITSGALDLLGRDPSKLDDSKKMILLEQARTALTEINRMIDALLRGSRAELLDEKEEVELASLIEASVNGFGSMRPVRLNEIPVANVTVNIEAFNEALGTLLENAVKHSPAGTEIEISADAVEDMLAVQVTNDGGLPTDMDTSDLFLPLRRGDAEAGGVGLGLYIARRLARSMGGDVEAQASDDQVTFRLLIPSR